MAECTIQLSIDEFLKSYKTLLCKYNEYLDAEEVSLDDTNKIKDQIRELLEYYKDILVLEAYQDIETLDTLIAGINQKLVNGDFVGQDGINGSDGNDGYTPIKGTDYFDGKDGQDGFSKGGFKNYIINGGFDVWKRGTSFSSASNIYTADRWYMANTSIETTATKVDNVNFNSLRLSLNGGTNGYENIRQYVEGDKLAGKTVTISFKIKWHTYNPNSYLYGYSSFGGTSIQTGGIGSGTGEWENISITYTFNSSWAGASYIGIGLIGRGSNITGDFDFEIAQVQLEDGSVATPFEQRPYGLELSLCQRYYQVIDGIYVSGYNNGHHGNCFPLTINEMRVAPTVVDFTYHDQPFTTRQVTTTISFNPYLLHKNSISVRASSSGAGMIMAFIGNVKLDAEI